MCQGPPAALAVGCKGHTQVTAAAVAMAMHACVAFSRNHIALGRPLRDDERGERLDFRAMASGGSGSSTDPASRNPASALFPSPAMASGKLGGLLQLLENIKVQRKARPLTCNMVFHVPPTSFAHSGLVWPSLVLARPKELQGCLIDLDEEPDEAGASAPAAAEQAQPRRRRA